MVNNADLSRMRAQLEQIVSPSQKEEEPVQVESSNEQEKQDKVVALIHQAEDIIKQATVKLEGSFQEAALQNLKFSSDGVMMPNVNSCITSMHWLEELGRINGEILKLVKDGAQIPEDYLASQNLTDSLANRDYTLGKEERGLDLKGSD